MAFVCSPAWRPAMAIHARRRHAARRSILQYGAGGVPRSPSPCEAVLQFMRQSLGGTKCATIIVVRATRFEWKPTEWRKPHESWSEDVLAGLCVAVYCES